jgi:ATP-binding cassette subfamily B protein
MIPLDLLVSWSEGMFAIGAGALLKQRLLHGALKLDPEEMRHRGAGQLLGRVMESEAVESLALSGGILGLLAVIELMVAAAILASGAGGGAQAFHLLLWVVVTLLLAWRYYVRYRRWTDARLDITEGVVERLVGHRTRLAQGSPARRQEGEDRQLEGYLGLSLAMDRADLVMTAVVPRGWLLVGLGGVAGGFVSGAASPVSMAVSLGGILLAYHALDKLSSGTTQLAGAALAWRRIGSLYRASGRPEAKGDPESLRRAGRKSDARGSDTPLLQAHALSYRYRERGSAVLQGCSLELRMGERLLLRGDSGVGKSTLVSLLSGLRRPDHGIILLRGTDRASLGSNSWRRRVAAAPQFHENHVMTESLAFNLLLGRRWPASSEELSEAEALCRELGLGELIDRMPSGVMQMVGEGGWQLSHGERSRVYLARALLQRSDLVVLDESFGALDPETLERALRCVLSRAPALVVVAQT